jgi:hypothetical protein
MTGEPLDLTGLTQTSSSPLPFDRLHFLRTHRSISQFRENPSPCTLVREVRVSWRDRTCQMRCTTSQSCARYLGCSRPRRRSGSESPRGYDPFPFGAEALRPARPARLGKSGSPHISRGFWMPRDARQPRYSVNGRLVGSLQGLVFNNHQQQEVWANLCASATSIVELFMPCIICVCAIFSRPAIIPGSGFPVISTTSQSPTDLSVSRQQNSLSTSSSQTSLCF